MAVNYGSVPFAEAVDFLRDKVNVPTEAWTDVWEGQHARAFTVAGAAKEDLLVDLREAVTAAVADGETLEQFRRRFDDIVKRRGWAYNGGRNWRTRVIYETNMRTAYQAGRYQQLQAVKARRPFWQYVHSDLVTHPRPQHQAWDGMVLAADDPWWDTHYPPNGWGCQCSVRALGPRDLARLGKRAPDDAPDIVWEQKSVGIRGPNPRVVRVPEGIDPGWGYNVGRSATGKQLTQEKMAQWKATRNAWRPMIQQGSAEAGRPARIPMRPPPGNLGPPLESAQEIVEAIQRELGGPRKTYTVGGMPVTVDAQLLARHLEEAGDPRRAEYIPFIDDAISRPYEAWLNFEEHQGTGRVRMVARLIKGYDLGRDRSLLVVTDASGGVLMSHTLFATADAKYIERQRQGVLLYGEDEGVQEE